MEKKVRYDAFISYRHTEPDRFVAKQLHRELESFTLPGNVRRKKNEGERTKISRVFRDREELPLAADLSDQITEALKASDFLIVICSPRLPQSIWCRKEIQTFIGLHGRERVFAVLAEGEPEDSFPEELLFREEETVREDGSVRVERISVEPLAADVRGKTNRERKKKIREEVVRLAAPMFDCTYDELKQRHRERRIKRIAGVAAVIAAVCFAFGAVSSAMALRIHGQNLEIVNQSRQIAKQKDQLELQYEEARITGARLNAQNALQLLEEGDRREAILLSAEVLSENPDVPQGEYALTQSLGVYRKGDSVLPEFMLKHDTDVQFMKLSPERDILLTVDDARMIYLWSIQDGRQLGRIEDYTSAFYISEDSIAFLDEERFACAQQGEIRVYDVNGQRLNSIVPETEEKYGSGAILGDGSSGWLAYVLPGQVKVYDTASLSLLFEIDSIGHKEFVPQAAFLKERNVMVLAWEEEGQPAEALVVDGGTGEIRRRFSLFYEKVSGLYLKGELAYGASHHAALERSETIGSVMGQIQGRLTAAELSQGEGEKWHYDTEEAMIRDLVMGQDQDCRLLMAAAGEGVTALREEDGSPAGQATLGESVISLGVFTGSNRFAVYTRGGRMLWTDGDKEQFHDLVELIGKFDCPSDNIRELLIGQEGKILVQPYTSNAVIVMDSLAGEGYQMFAQGVSPELTVLDNSGNCVLTTDSDERTVRCRNREGEILWSRELKEPVQALDLLEGDRAYVAVLSGSGVDILDRETGEETYSYLWDENQGDRTLNGSTILEKSYRELKMYDTLTGELQKTMDLTDKYAAGDLWEFQCGYLAVASINDRVLRLYYESGDLADELSVNAAYISGIFLLPGKTDTLRIYVNYEDDALEYYSWEKGQGFTLVRTYRNLEGQMKKVEEGVLQGQGFACLLKEDEPVCLVPDYLGRAEDIIYTGYAYGDAIYTVPLYTHEMLLEEAGKYQGF